MSKKLCKRCGSSNGILKSHTDRHGDIEYWVKCENPFCEEETASYETPEDAIADWNEPTEEQKLRIELSRATAKIYRLKEIVRKAEFSRQVEITEGVPTNQCPFLSCGASYWQEHDRDCPFYKWDEEITNG